LHDKTLKFFRKTLRVKPSASRQQSAEIYYLCLDYDNSLDEVVIKTKELRQRLEAVQQKMTRAKEEGTKLSQADLQASQELFEQLVHTSENDIKAMVKGAHERGEECKCKLPKDLRFNPRQSLVSV